MQSVLIATPVIDGKLDYRYVAALMGSCELLRTRGIGWETSFEVGNSLIPDARNRLVSNFLAGNYTDLMFIDADIAWQPEDLLRLLGWQFPMVAATYPRKTEATSFTVQFGDAIEARGELVTARRVGTGFMRLRRDCIQAMVTAYSALRLIDHKKADNANLYSLFDTGVVGGEYIGEDYLFCDRWRAIGGEVLVDPTLNLQHIGTGIWQGALRDHLQPKAKS